MIEKTTWFQLQPLYKHLRQQAENKKFFKYLEISATFSLIAIFMFTALTPTASAISKLVGEIKSKQVLEKKLKNKINSIILAQENYSSMQENSQYQILEASFPSRPNYYQSAQTFSSASNLSNTSLSKLEYDLSSQEKSDSQDQNKLFGVNPSVVGEYQATLEMIKEITQSRRLIDIETLQLSQSDQKDISDANPDYINLNISTKLFYLPTTSNDKK